MCAAQACWDSGLIGFLGVRVTQVRYLQGQVDRLKEKAAQAERSAAASLAQKVRLNRNQRDCNRGWG